MDQKIHSRENRWSNWLCFFLAGCVPVVEISLVTIPPDRQPREVVELIYMQEVSEIRNL